MNRIFLFISPLVLFLVASLKEAAAYSQFLGNKVVCPASGEAFSIRRDSKKTNYKGKVYYFCCSDCDALFNSNQKKYSQTAEEKKGERKQDVFSSKTLRANDVCY